MTEQLQMIDWNWILASGTDILMVAITGIGIYVALIFLTRMSGLRSFSKMSSFDFAVTVAYGSIIASTVLTEQPSLFAGITGLAVLYGIQYVVSTNRRSTSGVENLVDNEPLLIMDGERILSNHLDEARMTEEDLKSKLRREGITHPSQVLAVVFETTGSVSVLRRNDEFSGWLLEGVRGAERFSAAEAY